MDDLRTMHSADTPFFKEDGVFCPAAIFASMAATFCCQEDSLLTLNASGTSLSSVLGYSADEIAYTFHNHLLELIPIEDRQEVLDKLPQPMAASAESEFACRFFHKDGRQIWALVKCRRVTDPRGNVCLCGILTDISYSKAAQDDLKKHLDQLNIILSQTENIIFEWDIESDSIFFSDTWERIFGYPPITKDFGKSVSDAVTHLHPDDVPLLFRHLQVLKNGTSYQAVDARVARADGQYLWCRFRASAIRSSDGELRKLVGIIINIDDEKRETSALKKQAERDSLTKLLNKQAAYEKATQYLSSSSGSVNCVLMIIDLDHFKHVNDQYGHMVGDSVLTQCAKEIRRLFRPTDVVARIGGDEFLVLMKDVSDRLLVQARCSQLILAFRSILHPYLQAHSLSCSIGAAFAPDHGTTYFDLFVAADRALYHAKSLGKNQYTFYNSDIEALPTQPVASAVNTQIDSNNYSDPFSD